MNQQQPDRWWVSDQGKVHGPYTWRHLTSLVIHKKFSNKSSIKNDTWPYWQPTWQSFHPQHLFDAETVGMMPDRYDALFTLGVFLFIFGIFQLMVNSFMGAIMMMLSTCMEVAAVVFGRMAKPKSVSATIGNVMAVLWIIFQVIVALFIFFALADGL